MSAIGNGRLEDWQRGERDRDRSYKSVPKAITLLHLLSHM
jgi:hypothetical protein